MHVTVTASIYLISLSERSNGDLHIRSSSLPGYVFELLCFVLETLMYLALMVTQDPFSYDVCAGEPGVHILILGSRSGIQCAIYTRLADKGLTVVVRSTQRLNVDMTKPRKSLNQFGSTNQLNGKAGLSLLIYFIPSLLGTIGQAWEEPSLSHLTLPYFTLHDLPSPTYCYTEKRASCFVISVPRS